MAWVLWDVVFIVAGLAIADTGCLLLFLPKGLGLGRLPGGVVIDPERFTLYLPLAT